MISFQTLSADGSQQRPAAGSVARKVRCTYAQLENLVSGSGHPRCEDLLSDRYRHAPGDGDDHRGGLADRGGHRGVGGSRVPSHVPRRHPGGGADHLNPAKLRDDKRVPAVMPHCAREGRQGRKSARCFFSFSKVLREKRYPVFKVPLLSYHCSLHRAIGRVLKTDRADLAIRL